MRRLGASLLAPLGIRGVNDAISPQAPTGTPTYTSFGPPDESLNPDLAQDYARDARLEVMRRAIESLKEAGDTSERIQLLDDVNRMITEDPSTKNGFREMDGFLCLMNIFSTLQPMTADESDMECVKDTLFSAFRILSQALSGQPKNRAAFESMFGLEVLHQTLYPLIASYPTCAPAVMSGLLSFAMSDASFRNFYATPSSPDPDRFKAHSWSELSNPIPLICMLRLCTTSPNHTNASVTLKITEKVSFANRRNAGLLSQAGAYSALIEMKRSFINELPLIRKLLQRFLEMGLPSTEAHNLVKSAVKCGGDDSSPCKIDSGALEDLKAGMRSAGKWPDFIAFGSTSAGASGVRLENIQLRGKSFPGNTGLTFMTWVYIEKFPTGSTSTAYLLKVDSPSPPQMLCSLRILFSGHLSYQTASQSPPVTLKPLVVPGVSSAQTLPLRRWVHLTLIHLQNRSGSNVRLFMDGIPYATGQAAFPKTHTSPINCFLGNDVGITGSRMSSAASKSTNASWYLASSRLLLQALSSDAARIVCALGPRYFGTFQDSQLARLLSFKASTSISVAISQQAVSSTSDVNKALRERGGLGASLSHMAFAVYPHAQLPLQEFQGVQLANVARAGADPQERITITGDAKSVALVSLDSAVWTLGAAPLLLRLLELANNETDLSNALTVLSDCVTANWRVCEDMERRHGFLNVISALRTKVPLITLDIFHVIFEHLGFDFRQPEKSVIINVSAYRVLALDFSFWSLLPAPIQRQHLGHFELILQTSRFRLFNAKHRISKLGVIQKLLYVLQTKIYREEMVPEVVASLACVARQNFSTEGTIKPIVSYLAANLEPSEAIVSNVPASPSSPTTPIEKTRTQERAEQVLEALTAILSSPPHLMKFASALPAARICLLLLGSRPTATVASQILELVGLMVNQDPNFTRKLDSVSFWKVLVDVLPMTWGPSVHVAAFDLLLGRPGGKASPRTTSSASIGCGQILPAIIAALDHGLQDIVNLGFSSPDYLSPLSQIHSPVSATDSYVEVLAEEFIELHSTNSQFRKLFQRKVIVGSFIKACRSFITKVAQADQLRARMVRISEKLTHLALMLALDVEVDGKQKEELLTIMKIAQHEAVVDVPLSNPRLTSRGFSVGGSLRLDISPHILKDRVLKQVFDRTADWRRLILAAETQRLRKAQQDQRQYLRSLQRQRDWQSFVHTRSAVWPIVSALPLRTLDETEGPLRVRKRLRPVYNFGSDELQPETGDLFQTVVEHDSRSLAATVDSAWGFSDEQRGGNTEDERSWGEVTKEDKNRRVRHELEVGDVIEDVRTVTRIVGVDASPALLIVGKTHVYLLEGLVQDSNGEIIDARDAPKDVLSVPGSLHETDPKQSAQRWAIDQLAAFSKRTFLFRDVALEIYFKDSRSILIVFGQAPVRQMIIARLHIIRMQALDILAPVVNPRAPILSRVGSRLSITFQSADELYVAQRRWQAREISNFTYISLLNQASGRTPNDLTQYPVFPWVLQDYSSDLLDLKSEETFRDLSKPIGALTPAKQEAAELRFSSLKQVEETPFHYGTHYSSSMIVTHFLIRLSPFSNYFKKLQGGDWDLPDRLFSDIRRAWESASNDSRGDVRELIPEFFTCPEFLLNLSNLDFGVQTASTQRIDSVILPTWAKEDPWLFIDLHRKALESDFVSKNLPSWIDLVWGYKQRDENSLNVYHPLSYEGAIDLDAITDPLQKEATAGIIHNFGQTPKQIFTAPHPMRSSDGPSTLPCSLALGVVENLDLLQQNVKPVIVKDRAIERLVVDSNNDFVTADSKSTRSFSQSAAESVEWGGPSRSLRLIIDGKIVDVVEETSISCCEVLDNHYVAAGLEDTTVCIWKIVRSGKICLKLAHVMRSHNQPATCIAWSTPWSMIVTGSPDETAIVWDLNRGSIVDTVIHDSPVTTCAIQDSSGNFATCSRGQLMVHTVNAHLLISIAISSQELVKSLSFHERDWSPIPILGAGCADGSIILRTWNADATPIGKKAQWQSHVLRVLVAHVEPQGRPSIDALRFCGEDLFHGDHFGNVYQWSLVPQL